METKGLSAEQVEKSRLRIFFLFENAENNLQSLLIYRCIKSETTE